MKTTKPNHKSAHNHAPARWYISPNPHGANNGTSWANAWPTGHETKSCIKPGDVVIREEVQ